MLFDFPRKLLLMQAGTNKFAEDTATGNPLTFLTNIAKPLRSLVANFLPVQSGTGDPSPENVRPLIPWQGLTAWHTGKNLFDGEYPGIQSGTALTYRPIYVGDSAVTISTDMPLTGEDMYANIFALPGNVQSGASTANNGVSENIPRTVTPANGYITIAYRNHNSDPRNYNLQIEVGNTATAFEPYTGQSYPVNLQKNLLNATGTSPYLSLSDGVYTLTSQPDENKSFTVGQITLKQGETYILNGGYSHDFRILISYNGVYYISGTNAEATFTATGDDTVTVIGVFHTNVPVGTQVKPMIRLATDNDSTFQPYIPPVYGGYVDLVTGEGAISPIEIESFKWGDGRSAQVIGNVERRGFIFAKKVKGVDELNADTTARFCSVAPWGYSYIGDNVHFYGGEWSFYVFLPVGTSDDLEFQICAERDIAQTQFTFTPQQINALVGTNTIWSDTNGENTVVFLKKA